jgi:hypothetical protein
MEISGLISRFGDGPFLIFSLKWFTPQFTRGPNAEQSGGKWANGHYREAPLRRSRDSQ